LAYYNMQGEQIDRDEWIRLFEANDSRRVAQDTLADGTRISTVLLGLDHSFGHGPPLIFETMVFPNRSYDEQDANRYTTLADAVAGHDSMVEKWRAIVDKRRKGVWHPYVITNA
jgi:hypothetical protein